MRLIKNTTELIGIKDQNIKISLVFETDTHIEIQAKLDYPAPSCPHCHGKMIKYDFQKPSKIPLLEQAGTPTLLRLKKHHMKQSMSRVAHCIDNGPMEGFWGILKSEMYYLRKFSSPAAALPASAPELEAFPTRSFHSLACYAPCRLPVHLCPFPRTCTQA